MKPAIEFNNDDETLLLHPVSGHDIYIIAQALHYAIKYIDGQPEHLRELNTQADMWEILEQFFPDYRRMFERLDRLERRAAYDQH
jgi:hypothetical protein